MKRFISIALAVIMLFALTPFSASADGDINFRLSDDETYYIVSFCNNNATDVVIPSIYEGIPVKSINGLAFASCRNLKSVVIPDSITEIGDYAFYYCDSLTSLRIPQSVTYIGESAFWKCQSLGSIAIGNQVTTVGSNAFRDCYSLTDIYCESESKPESWADNWNQFCDANVHWNSNTVKITKNLSSLSAPSGSDIKISVEAIGVGLTYKWYFKNKTDSSFALTNTFKSNSYSIKMDSTRASRQVYCEITNIFGKTVRTNIATLGMAVKITKQPKNVAVQNGNIAKTTVKASGEGKIYQWYYKDKNATKFTLTNSFKGDSYYVPMNSTRASRQVYCVITDKYGNSVKTNTVTLGMSVKITKQPASVTVENGNEARVTLTASGEGKTYKWYFKDRGMKDFKPTDSFKGGSYYITMTNARAGRQVYCIVTDKYGNSEKTSVVTLNN